MNNVFFILQEKLSGPFGQLMKCNLYKKERQNSTLWKEDNAAMTYELENLSQVL